MKPEPPTSAKVRLKLTQPAIICSGRDFTTCFYRGKVIESGDDETGSYRVIQFKVHGELKEDKYYDEGGFRHPDFEDIKIVAKED
jgi:hypothetical protein